MIPYGRQTITDDDITAVVDVLKSDFITQGNQVPAFETALCEKTQAKYAVAVNSATSALHIACQSLGLGEGDYLWTSPITFVASANCARLCGAEVDFVDIDSQTYTLCSNALENKLKKAKVDNTLPKIVVAVHLCGHSCDMQAIKSLSIAYGFTIIEDASHAVGAQYKGSIVGSCDYSDITVFSFHPVKIITTGEGGVALTNQKTLAEKMRLQRSHGITRDADKMQNTSDGPWYYEQLSLGQNYRLTDIQAALGLSQLARLDAIIVERRSLVLHYQLLFKGLIKKGLVTLPYEAEGVISSYHLFVVRINFFSLTLSQKALFEAMINAGIGVNLHYIPVYRQPYYQVLNVNSSDYSHNYFESYPNAEQYYREAISLPLYPGLTAEEQAYVIQTLESLLVKDKVLTP